MTPTQLARLREDTPGAAAVNHLLACGSALMPQPVIDAVVEHTELEARIGGYEAHATEHDRLDTVYGALAELVGGHRDEIAVVENATVAWCQAFYAMRFEAGDRVLTSEAEYAANYVAFLQRRKRDGIIIDVVPSDSRGATSVDALAAMLDERVKLIAITWIPTNGGLVNPAAEIGRVARDNGIPFLLDACQAVGQMPTDVRSLNCDFLTGTGRKFLRGPRGTGFLWARRTLLETLEPAMIDHFAAPWTAADEYELRGDARRFETWENSYALRAGLLAAVRYALDVGLEPIRERAWDLAARLRSGLHEIPGAVVHDIGSTNCAIVSFTIEGLAPEPTVERLRRMRIHIGTSDPDSTLLDSQRRDLPVLFRAAPHYFNTEDEVDALLAALR